MLRVLRIVRSLLRSLRIDTRGATAVIYALSIIPILGFVGLAIDGARVYLLRDALQKSLDAAALASGHVLDTANIEADAQMYFDSNFDSLAAYATDKVVTVTKSADNNIITLNGSAAVNTTFMALFGFDKVTVAGLTEVTRETRGLELAMVMDNTGSMASNNKMGDMKAAATSLLDKLYGGKSSSPLLYVSVVPFVAVVNAGGDKASWLNANSQARITNGDFASVGWKGCIMARGAPFDQDDTPPGAAPFEAYLWDSGQYGNNDWRDRRGRPNNISQGPSSRSRSPNKGCGDDVHPLSNTKADAQAAIDAMQPWDRTGTHINQGMVWAWRAISPNWQGLWGGPTPPTMPLEYANSLMDKAVIVLTDGDNTIFSSQKTAYGNKDDFGFGNNGVNELNNRMTNVCEAMKTENIIIFSITFGNGISADTQLLMESCATIPAYYFHAPNGTELNDAFDIIGKQLSSLRLSR